MMQCRICKLDLLAPAFFAPAPALTSINTHIDIDTAVYLCEHCGHAQNPEIPDIGRFYDSVYRISMETDDHDQIFTVGPDGRPIYRTDHQTEISLRLLDPVADANVLDYGAAKSTTLRKMLSQRPDIVPHVFDVSSDYQTAWQGWVRPEHQAVYHLPADWHGRFDAAMSHFAIEHVADPLGFLRTLKNLLKPGGRLLLSLPDVDGNPGDMAVVDHLNHFTRPSLHLALTQVGFDIETIDTTSFPGAFFVTAIAAKDTQDIDIVNSHADSGKAHKRNLEICAFWARARALMEAAARRLAGERCAIYGAGFYGTWIGHRIAQHVRIEAFLDQNPGLQGSTRLGRPILPPDALDRDIRSIFVGLNPLKARRIIGEVPGFADRDLDLIWLE